MMNTEHQRFTKEEYVAPQSEIVLFDSTDVVMEIGGSAVDPFARILDGIEIQW